MEIKGNLVIIGETHPKIEGVCGETCPWYNADEGNSCRLFGLLRISEDALNAGFMGFDRHAKCVANLRGRDFYRQPKRWRNPDENADSI